MFDPWGLLDAEGRTFLNVFRSILYLWIFGLGSLAWDLELKAFGSVNPDNVPISKLGSTQKKAIQIMAQNGWQ